MRGFLFIALISVVLVAETRVCLGQTANSPVSANVLSNRVPVGEFGTLIIKVRANNATMPEQIVADGLEVSYSGNQSSLQIVNGIQALEFSYFFRFQGNEVGTFTIPSVQVRIADQTYDTQPIQVTIYERDHSDNANATRPEFGKLELAKNEFFVNEIVPFTLTAYVRGRGSISEIVRPRLEHESFIFDGFRAVQTDATEFGNTLYSYAVMPSTFFPLKAGEHRLGPASLGVKVMEAGSGFGLSAFFSRSVVKEIATNTVTTTVKPLPDGAPTSFTGGVGMFDLSGKPSTVEMTVGDPISMEFSVSGVGNLRTMSAPLFAGNPDSWKTYQSNKTLNEEEDSDGTRPGIVRFSQVIIPETVVTEIPPFELTFFDPVSEQYVTRRTEPFPITVAESGAAATSQVMITGNTDPAEATVAESPKPSFEDALYIVTGRPRWIAASELQSAGWLFYGVQILFSVALCTVLAIGVVRWFLALKARSALPEAPRTFRQAVKQIPGSGANKREFYRSVSTALGLWEQEHREIPHPVADVVERISARSQDYLYSGNDNPKAKVDEKESSEVRSILKQLSRK
ncbi:MAG: BatD family protein [Verrucomicrobiota bacterium]